MNGGMDIIADSFSYLLMSTNNVETAGCQLVKAALQAAPECQGASSEDG